MALKLYSQAIQPPEECESELDSCIENPLLGKTRTSMQLYVGSPNDSEVNSICSTRGVYKPTCDWGANHVPEFDF